MRLLTVGIALFAAALNAQAPSRLKLRAEAPAALSAPDKPLTLLFRPAGADSSDCKEVAAAQQEMAAFGLTAVVVLDREPWECSAVPPASRMLDEDKLGSRIEGKEAADAQWWMVIVDADRRVRLIRAFGKQDLKQMTAVAKQWNAGRQRFSTHCGHCHGDDGADTSYPNSKTLAGISQRHTPDQIIEAGENFGAVSVATWSKADIDSLLLYISGL